MLLNLPKLSQKIRSYFESFARKKKEPQDKSGVHWTARKVINVQRQADVEKICLGMSGALPGAPAYMAKLQSAITQLLGSLTEEERASLDQTAQEWNSIRPSPKLQYKYVNSNSSAEQHGHRSFNRNAIKNGEKEINKFAKRMLTQMGMRVFVLSSFLNPNTGLVQITA